MSTLLDRQLHEHQVSVGRYLDPFRPASSSDLAAVRAYIHSGSFSWDSVAATLLLERLRVNRQALSLSFNHGFQILAGVFVLALALVPWLKSPALIDPEDASH